MTDLIPLTDVIYIYDALAHKQHFNVTAGEGGAHFNHFI